MITIDVTKIRIILFCLSRVLNDLRKLDILRQFQT